MVFISIKIIAWKWKVSVKVTGDVLNILGIHGAEITKKNRPPRTFCLIILLPDRLSIIQICGGLSGCKIIKQNVPGV